jgi:transposase
VAPPAQDEPQPILDAPGSPAGEPHVEKKRFRPSEQARLDVHDRRVQFVRWSARVAPERLILIDESGCNLAMSPTCAWSIKGQRAYDHRPTNWGGNITAVAAIRNDEVVCQQSYPGAMNTPRFIEFVERRLVPRLRPGDIVVLDNLLPHKAPRARALVEEAGAELVFLPPYSPDFNPIEPFWGFVKAKLQRAKERTVGALRSTLRRIIRRVPVRHLASWFRHCGFHHQPNRSRV